MEKSVSINPQEFVEKVISKIKTTRKNKGYSLEYMAEMLGLSVSGYNKIENNLSNITLERIIEIQTILEISLAELLELKAENIYTQTLHDNAVGYQQIEHLYQENKQTTEKLILAYKDEIAFLRSKLNFKAK